jgi:hypothetical protein
LIRAPESNLGTAILPIGGDEFNASLFKTAALQFSLYRSTAHTPVDIFCDPARGVASPFAIQCRRKRDISLLQV